MEEVNRSINRITRCTQFLSEAATELRLEDYDVAIITAIRRTRARNQFNCELSSLEGNRSEVLADSRGKIRGSSRYEKKSRMRAKRRYITPPTIIYDPRG